MSYFKYIPYVYLIFALSFFYSGFTKIGTEESPWLSFLIAGVAVFMFFFRRKFAKRFEDNTNKKS